MKTNKNITIDIDLVNRVTSKLPPNSFSALVESLLKQWDKKTPEGKK